MLEVDIASEMDSRKARTMLFMQIVNFDDGSVFNCWI